MSFPGRNNTVLSLCDFTGAWSQPYRDAGYNVVQVDLRNGLDVRLLEYPGKVRGVLAAPPCTEFAAVGSRWRASKPDHLLTDALAIVDACLRIVVVSKPRWWVLENPVGRLRRYLGDPRMTFNPCDFGDPYTKRTLLWGSFRRPQSNPVEPVEGSKMHAKLGSTAEKEHGARSVTPGGFARAFFEANP